MAPTAPSTSSHETNGASHRQSLFNLAGIVVGSKLTRRVAANHVVKPRVREIIDRLPRNSLEARQDAVLRANLGFERRDQFLELLLYAFGAKGLKFCVARAVAQL